MVFIGRTRLAAHRPMQTTTRIATVRRALPDPPASPVGRALLWLMIFALLGISLSAQTLTIVEVSRARETAARSRGLSDAERGEIDALFGTALRELQNEIRWKAQQIGHARTKSVIGSELAAAQSASQTTPPGPPPASPSETVQQVEDEMARVRNDRASRIKRRDELATLRASLVQRRDAITARRAEIRETLQSIQDEIAVLPLAAASPQWEQASRIALQARRQSLEQELLSLAMERDALDLRRQLIPLQREAHLLALEGIERYLTELNARRTSARIRDASQSLQDTVSQARALATGFPALALVAAEIESHATELWGPSGIGARTEQTAARAEQMKVTAARLKEIIANTRRRYQNTGFFAPAGEWWPPRVEPYGKPAEVGALAIAFAAAEMTARRDVFRMEEERNAAPALETEIQQIVQAAGLKQGDARLPLLQSNARSILQLRRGLMTQYLSDERAYLSGLVEARKTAEGLLVGLRELQTFVMQHALWARSVSGQVFPSIPDAVRAAGWFLSPESWSRIFRGFRSQGVIALLWLSGLSVLLGLFFARNWWMGKFGWTEPATASGGHLRPLLRNICRGLMVALPAPILLVYAGWIIGRAAPDVDLARAVSDGTAEAGSFLLLALLVRRVLAPGAATDRLLGWTSEVRTTLDAAAHKLLLGFTPLCFVFAALASEGMTPHGESVVQTYHNSLGRLCFIVASLLVLVVGRRALRPGGPVVNALGTGFDAYGVARARVARGLLTIIFFSTFLLALAGFYITAYLLMDNVMKTAAFTFVLILAAAAIRQWRLEQEEKLLHSTGGYDAAAARTADLHVRRLSRFGLTLVWLVGALVIWSAALPALAMLQRVQLLPEFRVTLDREAVSADSPAPQLGSTEHEPPKTTSSAAPAIMPLPSLPATTQSSPAKPPKPLFLSDVLFAVFVGILTSMLVSSIPGLLQFTLFRRLSLDTGGQYAANTVARYLVIFAGLIAVSGILGLDWSKVQWLAAALTFGIGFGLQEIFANFAAGLILLFDRSIRVGDAVTVGNLSGVVARIQMRATTVTLWDRSDMVVPNKEFITTKLVNWTLSNPETRVDLRVGVAYDSNVEQVREVLMRIANDHPAVMKTPEPQVLLTEFAGSSINFELRVFGLYSYGRPNLLDELHRAVAREFRALGIEIAYPQLDVHLKPSTPPPDGLES